MRVFQTQKKLCILGKKTRSILRESADHFSPHNTKLDKPANHFSRNTRRPVDILQSVKISFFVIGFCKEYILFRLCKLFMFSLPDIALYAHILQTATGPFWRESADKNLQVEHHLQCSNKTFIYFSSVQSFCTDTKCVGKGWGKKTSLSKNLVSHYDSS